MPSMPSRARRYLRCEKICLMRIIASEYTHHLSLWGPYCSAPCRWGLLPPDWYSAYTSTDPGDTDLYVAMPLNEWWGLQDSNCHYQLIPVDAQARAQHRNVTKYRASLSSQYTDDMFMFGDELALDGEVAIFTAEGEAIVGKPAVAPSKRLYGQHIDIIGLFNDISPNHTIGLTTPMFLKLVCNVYVTVPTTLCVGDSLPIPVMERLSSHAIRCADVIHAMQPYSRGFAH